MSMATAIALIVDEGTWLTLSVGVALLTVGVLLAGRARWRNAPWGGPP